MHNLYRTIVAFAAGLLTCSTLHAQPLDATRAGDSAHLIEVIAFAVAPRAEQQNGQLHPASQDHVYAARSDAAPKALAREQPATLFTAAAAIGFPDSVASQLVEIFADHVDFHRELHGGFRCSLVYEAVYDHGQVVGAGRIVAAELQLHDRRLTAYYFDGGAGRAGYFSAEGLSLSRTFRRTPLEFTRITSQYSLSRLHPILGIWRAHRGVDYAAPAGAKVLAAADGILDFAGERGAYGKLVVLRHSGGYFTYYAHLASYEGMLSAGQRVEKGQVIGSVGMTGLATAPHLHYELRTTNASGERISIPPPEGAQIAPAFAEGGTVSEWRQVNSARFFEDVQSYRAKLRVARETHFVMLD